MPGRGATRHPREKRSQRMVRRRRLTSANPAEERTRVLMAAAGSGAADGGVTAKVLTVAWRSSIRQLAVLALAVPVLPNPKRRKVTDWFSGRVTGEPSVADWKVHELLVVPVKEARGDA